MCMTVLANGNKIHDYDKNRWEGERSTLNEAKELLVGTEVNYMAIQYVNESIFMLDAFLEYGINEAGDGPDFPMER